jgi:hypothetical protein
MTKPYTSPPTPPSEPQPSEMIPSSAESAIPGGESRRQRRCAMDVGPPTGPSGMAEAPVAPDAPRPAWVPRLRRQPPPSSSGSTTEPQVLGLEDSALVHRSVKEGEDEG